MAGLIDVGILKPELATSFAAGYRGAEQARQRSALAEQQLAQEKQQLEMNQTKLDQLKQDRAAMIQLQDSLKSAGQDPDLNKVFDALIATGNPEYVMKGIDGKRRLKEQQRSESVLRQFAPELFPAAPANAPAANAAAPAPAANALMAGPDQSQAEVNRLTSMAPAPAPAANALAPQPTTSGARPDINAMRRQLMMLSSLDDPRAKAMAEVLKGQIAELAKTHTVGGRIVSGAGSVLYEAPPETSDIKEYEYAKKNQGYKGSFTDFMLLKPTASAARNTVVNVQEKAEASARGKMLVDQYQDISKAANLAIRTLPSIEANLGALNKGLDTGFGTDAKAAGARILGALGVKDAEKFATDTQTFQSNAISAVLQKQLEQKGPQTESDARRIEQVGAELGKTKDANQFILSMAKEQLRRDVEQRNFYDRWYKTNKTYDGAEDAWFAGEGGKSLFERPALKKYAPGAPVGQSAVNQIPGQRPTPAPAAAAGGNTVSLPDGRVMTFPNAKAAADFKKAAGLQ